MFKKVLVANRGEIACRVIRTLKKLGITSVAVFSEADRYSAHTRLADEAYGLPGSHVKDTYLNQAKILEIVENASIEAVHPGYGLLSENSAFAKDIEGRGVRFIGPRPEQLTQFGLKHVARKIAGDAGVPLVPGSDLLFSLNDALDAARKITYPVMLKSTAGGGGIGMRLCHNDADLRQAYESVKHLGASNFGNADIYLEKYVEQARHIEAQLFGDGNGNVVILGDRDCSVQRRHQKVIEETPSPNLPELVRVNLRDAAQRLGESIQYRSAGTVEFIYDTVDEKFYFLEVNTRLQVEHPVTESVFSVDLVEWMVKLAAGESDFMSAPLEPVGHSIEARLYAENPIADFQPSAGTLHTVFFPDTVRVDSWIESGIDISPYYDPLLAKIIVHEKDRATAVKTLISALETTVISGVETNIDYLIGILRDDRFTSANQTTRMLETFDTIVPVIEVLTPGIQTTIQDYPGRLGYWDVGVPPSGPMDDLSFRLANRLLGNGESAPGLEMTVKGPTLRFHSDTQFCLTGADMSPTLNEASISTYCVYQVRKGDILALNHVTGGGHRCYLAVAGGFEVTPYLKSAATFTLGQFGGHNGRSLIAGDILKIAKPREGAFENLANEEKPPLIQFPSAWKIGVLYGPHGAPDFFTQRDIQTFFSYDWEVHYNSARTGVRLMGPKPEWARKDGGEAGLHPSNIHDCAYAVGSIDYTGDMPIILGPDGPSLGGFVCPAVVLRSELWKIGQLKPGDKVQFIRVGPAEAELRDRRVELAIRTGDARRVYTDNMLPEDSKITSLLSPTLLEKGDTHSDEWVQFRQSGEQNILIEFGEMRLDLAQRFKAHVLRDTILDDPPEGLIDLTPGIRSLQIHFDHRKISQMDMLAYLRQKEEGLPDINQMTVPTRIVRLPLSWDDEATRLAIQKYEQSVRKDAPWCPSNIEFIRRINGLASIDDVKQILFDANYLVMGLGDVYLGAPVATPIDPRHRLVTTKYNPARTWTPENAVGIGGAYLCIYGMEGPGGYQFVGRTLPVWNRFRTNAYFKEGSPWLLRFFDQIKFYPVNGQDLLRHRADFIQGQYDIDIEEKTFNFAEYQLFLETEKTSITSFKSRQQKAFEDERDRWKRLGQDITTLVEAERMDVEDEITVPEGCETVDASVHGSVWKIMAEEGETVAAGTALAVFESMKMEINLTLPYACEIVHVLAHTGEGIHPGKPLMIVKKK